MTLFHRAGAKYRVHLKLSPCRATLALRQSAFSSSLVVDERIATVAKNRVKWTKPDVIGFSPQAEFGPLGEVDESNLRLTDEDFDKDGNLKPLPTREEMDGLYENATSFTPKAVPNEFWITRRRPHHGPERKLTEVEQLRYDMTKGQFTAELAELRRHKGRVIDH